MKRLVLMLTVALFAAGMAMAQDAPRHGDKKMDPKERAERMTERMAKEYTLNDSQKQQLLDANIALAEKMGEMPMRRDNLTEAQRAEKKAAMEKKRDEMKAAHEAYDAQLKKIMTPEQYAAYSAKKDSRHPGERK